MGIREVERQKGMEEPKQMIEAKLKRSGFVLTIETEESVGYRSGLKTEALRVVYINLERRTVQYELTKRGAANRHRVEHFETIEQLAEQSVWRFLQAF